MNEDKKWMGVEVIQAAEQTNCRNLRWRINEHRLDHGRAVSAAAFAPGPVLSMEGSRKVHELDAAHGARDEVSQLLHQRGVKLLWNNVPETPSVQCKRQTARAHSNTVSVM